MIRNIIEIDQDKCNGCGLCVKACHEGAIQMINQKACLVRDDYCDGLGDCLPHCPMDAIKIIKKEAKEFNQMALESNKKLNRNIMSLQQWPCQLKLVSSEAVFLKNAHLLIAADCCAYAYADFHKDFMNKRITLIGCPKLDNIDYSVKIKEILINNDIKSITLVRMEVPCCKKIEVFIKNALVECQKNIHFSTRIISTSGKVVESY